MVNMLYICRFKKRPLISNQHKYCSTAVWYFCLCDAQFMSLLRNTEETYRNCGKRKIRMKVGDSCSLWLFFFPLGWRLGGHPYTHPTHHHYPLPPALASLHVPGSGPWEWMAPGLCSVFEASQECEASFFFLPSLALCCLGGRQH